MNITRLPYHDIMVYLAAIPQGDAPRRERERHTVAALARHAISDNCILCHTAAGAPYVHNSGASISVSHSMSTAALAVGKPGIPLGLDIESPRDQLWKIASRVLSEHELSAYGRDIRGLLAAWTLKEASYKAAGIPGLDFRLDIKLPDTPLPGARVNARGRQFVIAACEEFDTEWISLVYAAV